MNGPQRLAAKLIEFPLPGRYSLAGCLGLERRLVTRAAFGRPVNAETYLALCAATGIDPITGVHRKSYTFEGPLQWGLLGESLRIVRGLQNLNIREASKEIGVSTATLSRLESGRTISTAALLSICTFMEANPADYVNTFHGKHHCNNTAEAA